MMGISIYKAYNSILITHEHAFLFHFRTWSAGRNIGDGWPTDSSGDLTDGKEWPVNSQSAAAFTDLVPEFEPGKPWKVINSVLLNGFIVLILH